MRRINYLTKLKSRVLFFGLFVVFSCSQTQGSGTRVKPLRFDGRWWQNASADEQQGFIYGYQDCRQPRIMAKASIDDYRRAVSSAVREEASKDPKAVIKAIEHAWVTLSPRDLQGGENYMRPHGYLDGEWWGSFPGQWPVNLASADRGYLDGYLACAATMVADGTVSKYQAAINQHYASGQHDHDAVADVLRKFLGNSLGRVPHP